jgi:predicted MPP superfamily phosphohydrolase
MKRIVLGLVLLSVAASVFVGGHLYVAQRLVLDPGLPAPVERWLLAGVWALAASLVAEPIAERLLPRRLSRLLAWPAALWMGVAFLLVVALGASELLIWLLGAASDPETQVAAARARALGVVALVGIATAVGMRGALSPPRHRRVEIRLPRWPAARDGYRIVQISDIHIGPILDRRFARQLTARVNALAPDLVAVTGDLVDGSEQHLAEEVLPFAELRGRDGVFFVTGNHDYFSGVDPWVERVRRLGMRVLRNERVTLGQGAAAFDLAGVEDHRSALYSRGPGEDLPAALAGRDPERALVLLAHDPSTFREASRLGVDLQISGHTHGGQIWPFGYVVRAVIPWVAGLYEANGSRCWVSRGTGFWGPPIRLFSPAEITELVLRSGAPGAAPAQLDRPRDLV